jgi:hypothetical protein
LRFTDLGLDPSERPWGYAGDPPRANAGPLGFGRASTCRTWLWSLEDSQCRAEPHLGRIAAPSLLVQALGDTGIFPSDARAIHDAMGAADKTMELVPGNHYFAGDGERERGADLVAGWLHERGA